MMIGVIFNLVCCILWAFITGTDIQEYIMKKNTRVNKKVIIIDACLTTLFAAVVIILIYYLIGGER